MEQPAKSVTACNFFLLVSPYSVVPSRLSTPHWRDKDINASLQRQQGNCPMTPSEVALLLSSLGFNSSTRIFLAAGDIYGAPASMAALTARFPHMISKVRGDGMKWEEKQNRLLLC